MTNAEQQLTELVAQLNDLLAVHKQYEEEGLTGKAKWRQEGQNSVLSQVEELLCRVVRSAA
jgi:hypothetical protein